MNQESGRKDGVTERILLAVDDSVEARRALEYVGRIVGSHGDFGVVLYHRLPALPPQLREHGGSEYPERETELGRELSKKIAAWVSSLEAALTPTLTALQDELIAWGMSPALMESCIDEDVYPGESLVGALRRVARERGCGTIAVAREHVPITDGVDGFFHHHTGDTLVREGIGFAVWVIE